MRLSYTNNHDEALLIFHWNGGLGIHRRSRYGMGSWVPVYWLHWLEHASGSLHNSLILTIFHRSSLCQYTNLYVGNPREVAYLSGSNSGTTVGAICGPWTEWHIIGNPSPGNYDFNCIHSVADINNNARNNGYEIGGLNHNGVTVAICYIEYSGSELCDSDTISNANDRACNVWVVCQN